MEVGADYDFKRLILDVPPGENYPFQIVIGMVRKASGPHRKRVNTAAIAPKLKATGCPKTKNSIIEPKRIMVIISMLILTCSR